MLARQVGINAEAVVNLRRALGWNVVRQAMLPLGERASPGECETTGKAEPSPTDGKAGIS